MFTVYQSFETLPADTPPLPGEEGDDSLGLYDRHDVDVRALSAHPTAGRTIVVPFLPARRGSHGDHVFALKRATCRYLGGGRLAVVAAQPPRWQRDWGRWFQTQYVTAQARLNVPATGVYDKATHDKLAPWYDAFSLSLLQHDLPDPRVAKIMGWWTRFYNTRAMRAYSQARPSMLGAPERITRADCSGTVAAAMDWAHVLPRVDWRWTNTDVQIHLGRPVSSLHVSAPGDVVLYGHGTDPNHEALYLGGGLVGSFGSYPAKVLPVDYDRGGYGGRIAIRRFVLD